MSLNILLINHYAGSPEMGMEFRPYYFAREWVKMGHRVDVIAADYSHLRRKNPKVEEDFQTEVIDGINYHWIKTNTYEGNGAKRAITMAQFIVKLWVNARKIVKEFEPDAVICSSTYPLDTFVGQHIRSVSKKKVKLIHEVHDMWPATLIELGGMSKYHPFVVAMQIGENSAYKHSDHVIALLEYSKEHMVAHGLKEDKFKWIPLGVDLNEWKEAIPLNSFHEDTISKLKNEGKFVVGYFGGHAMSNALDTLIDVAQKNMEYNFDNIHFVLVGDGVEKQNLMDRVKNQRIYNVTFLPPVDKKEIPELTDKFDCIYIGTHKNELYRFGLCLNKMIDAMMSQKPIICSITAPPTWVEKSGCGITVESGDVESIVKSINEVSSMSFEKRQEMGTRGSKYVFDNFDIEKLSIEVIDTINNID